MTGSDYNDLTKELTGKNLHKYKKHVDETYEDFKNRVVEGREIHPDLIGSLAGGRVYTGQMAFDLFQEVEAKRQAKDLPSTVRLPHLAEEAKRASPPATSGVELAEGQEMSPFAVVEEKSAGSASAPETATETVTQTALYSEVGPLGRGIVDGLGGIRDAAALAAEVFLVSGRVNLPHVWHMLIRASDTLSHRSQARKAWPHRRPGYGGNFTRPQVRTNTRSARLCAPNRRKPQAIPRGEDFLATIQGSFHQR